MPFAALCAGTQVTHGRYARRIGSKGSEVFMNFLWFLIVGLIAGWLAGVLMKGGSYGVLGDIVVGILGALIGGWLFGALGVGAGGGLIGSIIVATIGAVVLIFLLRLVKRA
jgi:uncharacterized membrane protein YeaQ/YmgE (transglycosylase-associated protein family)